MSVNRFDQSPIHFPDEEGHTLFRTIALRERSNTQFWRQQIAAYAKKLEIYHEMVNQFGERKSKVNATHYRESVEKNKTFPPAQIKILGQLLIALKSFCELCEDSAEKEHYKNWQDSILLIIARHVDVETLIIDNVSIPNPYGKQDGSFMNF